MNGTEKIAARVSRRLSAPPERVFDAWLNPEKVRAWMSAALSGMGLAGDVRRIEVDARIGGGFVFSDMRDEGEAVHWGNYLEMDRPHRLVFTWFTSEEEERENNSTVTLTLEPDGDGCVATIVHEMSADWTEYIDKVEGGWGRMLAQIGAMAEAAGQGGA